MRGRLRALLTRETNKDDAVAGVVLGGQSVPDGLAAGLLAGVNPVYGLYAYMFGMLGAALFTSSSVHDRSSHRGDGGGRVRHTRGP